MFTGLIQRVGTVKRVSRGRGLVLEFQFEPWPEPLVKGESVAVNGACLTVADCDATRFTADVLRETEARTGLAELLPGGRLSKLLEQLGTVFAMLLGLLGSSGVMLFFSLMAGMKAVVTG